MYSVIAFTHRATKEELEVSCRCLKVLEVPGNIYNIPNHKISDHLTDNSVVITFGRLAKVAVEQYLDESSLKNIKVTNLNHPRHLFDKQENIKTRDKVYKQLLEVKKFIQQEMFSPTRLEIKKEDLPDISANHILLLKKITDEANQTSCFQVSKNDKLIEIGIERREESVADIFITFSELYAVKLIMDILGTTEVKLVDSSKRNSD